MSLNLHEFCSIANMKLVKTSKETKSCQSTPIQANITNNEQNKLKKKDIFKGSQICFKESIFLHTFCHFIDMRPGRFQAKKTFRREEN